MKKPHIPLLVVITLLFGAFTLGYWVGQNRNRSQVLISVPAEVTAPRQESVPTATADVSHSLELTVEYPLDLNTATLEELMTLPGIGDVYAKAILALREERGGFTQVTELLNIEGIGEKRLEAILDLVVIGG